MSNSHGARPGLARLALYCATLNPAAWDRLSDGLGAPKMYALAKKAATLQETGVCAFCLRELPAIAKEQAGRPLDGGYATCRCVHQAGENALAVVVEDSELPADVAPADSVVNVEEPEVTPADVLAEVAASAAARKAAATANAASADDVARANAEAWRRAHGLADKPKSRRRRGRGGAKPVDTGTAPAAPADVNVIARPASPAVNTAKEPSEWSERRKKYRETAGEVLAEMRQEGHFVLNGRKEQGAYEKTLAAHEARPFQTQEAFDDAIARAVAKVRVDTAYWKEQKAKGLTHHPRLKEAQV